MTKTTVDSYLIEKKYLENAIHRAFMDGRGASGLTVNMYVSDTMDDMLRGNEPIDSAMLKDVLECFIKDNYWETMNGGKYCSVCTVHGSHDEDCYLGRAQQLLKEIG